MQRTSIDQLKTLLSSLGVARGTCVMVHSSVFSLGLVENRLAGVFTAFRDIIGDEGTLIVPTFSYSYRRGETFDVRLTPSAKEIGVFSEFVRLSPGAVRSSDPLFSMAAIGPRAERLMARESIYCFGAKSIYERLFEENVLFLSLGVGYSTGMSCFMHLERLAGVDYRRDLLLSGTTIAADGRSRPDEAMHYARNQDLYPTGFTNRDGIGADLENAQISRTCALGGIKHFSFLAKPFSAFVLDALHKDPHCMFIREKS